MGHSPAFLPRGEPFLQHDPPLWGRVLQKGCVMALENVVALPVRERVRQDSEPIATIYRNLGTASAEQVVTRARGELALTMAGLAAQVRQRDMQDLARQLRRLQRMAENLGMVSLGLVAGDVRDRRVITYGRNPQADVRAVNLTYKAGVAHFDIALQGEGEGAVIEGCSLPMPGDHNVSNALSAVAVARHLGMKMEEIKAALAGFGGVNRRFTKVAEVNGVTIIDDYGHHPVEIAAVLKAARQATSGTPGARVIAVHQPHRYSRLQSLFEDFCTCFNDADVVGIAEVYAAGEDPIAGASRDDLVAGLLRHGHRYARAVLNEEDLARLVREQAREGDMVVCLGAGTISVWAHGLPARLAKG